MGRLVVIHPGFPKSGTTALQASLKQAQQELKAQGYEYNPPWNNAHHRAAWALTKYTFGWSGKGGETTPISVWENLVTEVSKSSKSALISSEFLIRADSQTIKKIKNDFVGADFKIVFTLRPFAKVLPSRYQQTLKKGKTWTYDKWLHTILDGEKSNVQLLDYAGIIESWARVFGPDRVSIIIADETNPDSLYRSFETAVGLNENSLRPAKIKRLNRSLTASEVEVLRQVNLRKPKKWKWKQYNTAIRGKFVRQLSDNPSKFTNDSKLQLPKWAFEKLQPYVDYQLSAIADLPIFVHGDLQSLRSGSNDGPQDSRFIPAEMAADFVLQLASIQSLSETSTRGLVREIMTRIKKRFK